MLTKTKTALAAAIILSTASLGTIPALAGGNSGEYTGGFAVQGSTNGWTIQNRKGADAFGLAVTNGRALHVAPAKDYNGYYQSNKD